jgi:hypothetical protein
MQHRQEKDFFARKKNHGILITARRRGSSTVALHAAN